jgi:hypothetical protein
MHPFLHIFLTMLITSVVGMWLLGVLFRDGVETDRSVNKCRESWFPELWLRGKFGFWCTAVVITAIGSFQGLPMLWQYLRSHL